MHQYQNEHRYQREEENKDNPIFSNDLFDSLPTEMQSEPQRNIENRFELNQPRQEIFNYQDSLQEVEIKYEYKESNHLHEAAANLDQSFGDPLAINGHEQPDIDPLNSNDPIDITNFLPIVGIGL